MSSRSFIIIYNIVHNCWHDRTRVVDFIGCVPVSFRTSLLRLSTAREAAFTLPLVSSLWSSSSIACSTRITEPTRSSIWPKLVCSWLGCGSGAIIHGINPDDYTMNIIESNVYKHFSCFSPNEKLENKLNPNPYLMMMAILWLLYIFSYILHIISEYSILWIYWTK